MKFLLLFLILLTAAEPAITDSPQKRVLVCGAGGFIGYHLVQRYRNAGYWVRGVDCKYPEFGPTHANEFIILDLRTAEGAKQALDLAEGPFDEVFQLAANMGGMGFISSHDAEIMHDSALINLQVLEECRKHGAKKIFFSSSACVYPERNQLNPQNPKCAEDSAYPAAPDTEYGWEKLFSERLYSAYARDYGMDIRIARFHNIFGPQGTWSGGREKAPAALCRKIAAAHNGETVLVWGKGDQTRSFLYIDECLTGIQKLMATDKPPPILNIGSEEMISINGLAQLIAQIANKNVTIQNIPGPEGVRGRNSDNALIQKTLQWKPSLSLESGLTALYAWIEDQVQLTHKETP
jgi:nucleoside-diphosphate-sugar epimerase